MTTTNTPRTEAARFEALRSSALRQDCIPLKLGQELELELLAARDDAFNLSNALSKAKAEVEKLKTEYWFMEDAMSKEIAALKEQRDKAVEIAEDAIIPLQQSEYNMDGNICYRDLEKLKSEIE